MSWYGVDPGDLTPDEMYRRERVPRMSREEFEREAALLESENIGDECVPDPRTLKEAA